MNDQANELRQLVQQGGRPRRLAGENTPALVVVAGGKGGVGATTVALHLAVALADRGCRAALVDGDFQRADLTKLCGVEPCLRMREVLAGERTVADALVRVGGGISLLPGEWVPAAGGEPSAPSLGRLLEGFADLGSQVDAVVIDAGNGFHRTASRFWNAADEVLVLTTPDDLALMDAYAAIKVLAQRPGSALRPVVNRTSNETQATELAERLACSCRRFLGLKLETATLIPTEARLLGGAERKGLWEYKACPASRAFQTLAEAVQADLARRRAGPSRRQPASAAA